MVRRKRERQFLGSTFVKLNLCTCWPMPFSLLFIVAEPLGAWSVAVSELSNTTQPWKRKYICHTFGFTNLSSQPSKQTLNQPSQKRWRGWGNQRTGLNKMQNIKASRHKPGPRCYWAPLYWKDELAEKLEAAAHFHQQTHSVNTHKINLPELLYENKGLVAPSLPVKWWMKGQKVLVMQCGEDHMLLTPWPPNQSHHVSGQ